MSNAGSDFPLKPLPEEAACVALVAEAEKWLNRLKKVTQVCAYMSICIYVVYILYMYIYSIIVYINIVIILEYLFDHREQLYAKESS